MSRSTTASIPASSTRCSPRCAAEAEAVVKAGAPRRQAVETRTADMRYRGQGHEITVSLPVGAFDAPRARRVERSCFEKSYAATFGRTIPGLDVGDHDLDACRLAGRAADAAKSPPRPARTARPSRAAAGRATTRPTSDMQDVGGLSSRRPVARQPMPGPGRHRRGRDHHHRRRTGFVARINPIGAISCWTR